MSKEAIRKYISFFLSRLFGTGVDTAVLWTCEKLFFSSYFGVYILSPMISFEFATMSNYLFSYYWIWRNRIEDKSSRFFWTHFLTFNLSCIIGFLVKMAFLLLFKKLFGWNVVVCNLSALVISGILNYFLAEDWVFKKKRCHYKNELLTLEELSSVAPILQSTWGKYLGRLLFSICGVEKMNRLYDSIADEEGAASAAKALKNMGCDYYVGNAERMDSLPEGAFITVSNHPYGGLDGLMIIDLFCDKRSDYKVMVNNILGKVKSLKEVFITVTPRGKEQKTADATTLAGIRTVLVQLKEGHPVGFFPSGAVSDLHINLHKLRIEDRPWQESLIHLIMHAEVPIIPVRFFDYNSRFYYLLGLIGWRVRLLRLPRELFNKKKGQHRIGIGETITVEEQKKHASNVDEFSAFLRSKVYDMPMPDNFVRHSVLLKKEGKGDPVHTPKP
ncbi:MAG: GtrA family protein [Bacteroidales bacterium]|jgi:putative flippase GtrA/putative hemolysin|nr:GtrA family protein [Bacteroidales bacterium]MCI2122517.1 GtrA family protein [Bacteroidales bacterium]MCI2145384.1 GtrA family protein [Bacteroidales bacterium]